MPNILFKLGSLDLSTYVRVNPDEGLQPAQGDNLEPAFSDSPFFEGQYLTSLHAKNKEMQWPLFLHPSQAPYLQDALNQIVIGVNNALRPVTDLGQTLYVEWRNAQASNSTFYSVQFGRFEPAFNFRQTEKGWLAGILHLWALPYGHTATERIVGTYAAPANQSGLLIPAASITAAAAGGTILGDVSPQFDLHIRTGSYTGDDGQVGIISALPVASYTPIIPVGSFFALSPSAVIYGASGAWASQFLAMDSAGGSQGAVTQGTYNSVGYFSFALSPASVYSGDNRILGLVRARNAPFGLRAFDSVGNPLGPTVVASAMDGWQLVDYGVLSAPPWLGTIGVNIQAYSGMPKTASGIFSSPRAAPPWTKEHGPIFVVPNAYTLMELDWNSPVLTIDGFDGASGAVIGQDQLGNAWQYAVASLIYNGNSGLLYNLPSQNLANSTFIGVGTAIAGDYEMELVLTPDANTVIQLGALDPLVGPNNAAQVSVQFTGATPLFGPQNSSTWLSQPFVLLSGQPYGLKMTSRASMVTAYLYGPSGAFPGSASGAALVSTLPISQIRVASRLVAGLELQQNGHTGNATTILQSFRARLLASTGHQSLDTIHVSQPYQQNTRMLTASGPDVVDLQARQRGPLAAINLPVPSLGAGLFVASFNWDQGPANDLLNVAVRVRERFTYAR